MFFYHSLSLSHTKATKTFFGKIKICIMYINLVVYVSNIILTGSTDSVLYIYIYSHNIFFMYISLLETKRTRSFFTYHIAPNTITKTQIHIYTVNSTCQRICAHKIFQLRVQKSMIS